MTRTAAQIAAQVAVEAIANAGGEGYDRDTIAAVLANGVAEGVAPMYLDLVAPLLRDGGDEL